MRPPGHAAGNECSAGCASCVRSGPPGDGHPRALSGPAFGLVATGVFLVPLATALAGSLLAGRSPAHQLLGGFLGLVGGMLAAILLGTRAREAS